MRAERPKTTRVCAYSVIDRIGQGLEPKGEYAAKTSGILVRMGYSRRREDRLIADEIEESNRQIADVTLGQVCAANILFLDVRCHVCSRRGRYRVTRLIDRYGAGKLLSEFRDLLSADCPRRVHETYFRRCGAYFPGWKPKIG